MTQRRVRPTGRTRWRRPAAAGAALIGAAALALTGATPAGAHPFGAPQTVELSGSGSTVDVVWKASPDDLTALALNLDVLPNKRTFVYEKGALVPAESDESDAVVLAKAEKLGSYLTDRVAVRQAGQDCPGRLVTADDLAERGARLAYACPAPVTEGPVDVEVTTMTDVHPAYRTLASGPGGQRFTYSDGDPSHAWTLSAEGAGPSASARSALRLVGGLAALAVVGAGAWWWRRRRSA